MSFSGISTGFDKDGFAGMNLQRAPFQPLSFIPAGQQSTIMDQAVRWIEVVGHERLPNGGNHWCFYLRVGEDRSVCVDITPSYTVPSVSIRGGSKAYMIVSLLDYGIPPRATKAMKLDVPHGKKVHDFVDLLIQHGRHKYEFNGEGQGCRYWTDHQINLFDEHDLLVDRAQIQAAKAAILTQWPDQVQYALVQGGYDQ